MTQKRILELNFTYLKKYGSPFAIIGKLFLRAFGIFANDLSMKMGKLMALRFQIKVIRQIQDSNSNLTKKDSEKGSTAQDGCPKITPRVGSKWGEGDSGKK